MKTLLRWTGRRLLGLHRHAPIVTIGLILPLIYLLVLVVPLQVLTSVFDHAPGVSSTKTAVHLSPLAQGLLAAAGCLTALGSVLVGGLAKWMYRGLHSRGVLIIHLFAGAGAFLVCASMIYLGFWLLMVGYMLKAPWDDARDRVNTWLEGASGAEQGKSSADAADSLVQDPQ
jgi:hypothetical protein